MLPVEKAEGQIWLRDQHLCDVEYEISKPLNPAHVPQVQRITFVVPEEQCAQLLGPKVANVSPAAR